MHEDMKEQKSLSLTAILLLIQLKDSHSVNLKIVIPTGTNIGLKILSMKNRGFSLAVMPVTFAYLYLLPMGFSASWLFS